MAEEENKEEEVDPEGEAPKKSRGPLKLFGGVVGLIALGTVLAVVAMPSKETEKKLQGPAMHVFFADGEIVANPLDDNFSRYLKFNPSCSYLAYDLAYAEGRRADSHYETLLRESIQFKVSEFRIDEVMPGSSRDMFAAAIEEIAEPILFPVHIGQTVTPYDIDEESGLRVGDSQERNGSYHGLFWENVLHVDAVKKTLQLGEGPVASFAGDEYDLLVEAIDESKLYVDVSALNDEFVGDIHVGVMGRIRRLFTGDIVAQ